MILDLCNAQFTPPLLAMPTLSVVYHTGSGNTGRAAHALADGARSASGLDVHLIELTPAQIDSGRWNDEGALATLAASDAIVFGAPTYMGMVSGVFKMFADATAPLWFSQAWRDKIAGGFTSSGYPSGDKVSTLHYLATLAGQLRMIWVGPTAPASNLTQDGEDIDRWGFYLGVGVQGQMQDGDATPTAGDLETCRRYGARLAGATLRWTSGADIAEEAGASKAAS